MIQVTFKEQGEDMVAMTVEGHAMSAEYGKDLVCAAVSTLTISMVNNLERLTGVRPLVEQEPEGGYLYCELPQGLSDAQKQVAQILMKNCYLALKEDVAKSAPESLQVILIH